MFDEKELSEYKKIKPSPYLKGIIMASYDEKGSRKISLRQVVVPAFAVCMALLAFIAVWQYEKGGELQVYMHGNIVTDTPMSVDSGTIAAFALAKTGEPDLSVVLELNMKGEAEIAVSSGTLQVLDTEENIYKEHGKTLDADGNISLKWNVWTDSEGEKSMSIMYEGEKYTYTLEYNDENQCWTICQDK